MSFVSAIVSFPEQGWPPVKSGWNANHVARNPGVGSPESPPRPLSVPVPALAAKLGPATPGPGLKLRPGVLGSVLGSVLDPGLDGA